MKRVNVHLAKLKSLILRLGAYTITYRPEIRLKLLLWLLVFVFWEWLTDRLYIALIYRVLMVIRRCPRLLNIFSPLVLHANVTHSYISYKRLWIFNKLKTYSFIDWRLPLLTTSVIIKRFSNMLPAFRFFISRKPVFG